MKKRIGDTCYCSHWAEYYCDPYGSDQIQKFKDCCEGQGENYYWDEC